MRAMSVIGIVLIMAGALILAYQGFTYTHKEKIIAIGPIEATAEKKETIPLPPILGELFVVGGIVLLVVDRKGSKSHI
jgi:hypothetical protein